jgi:hypothetical protein
MSRKCIVLAVLAVVALAFAATAQAQTLVKQTITKATVVGVGDNFIVLKMPDGSFKGFDVPAGYLLNEAGTKIPLNTLKRGQAVTDTITITTTGPVNVYVEDVKDATVVTVVDRYLTVQMPDGTYRRYLVPKGYRFDVDGKSLSLSQLQPGMKISTTLVSENQVSTLTKAEYDAEALKPVPPAQVSQPAPPAETATTPPPAEAPKAVPPPVHHKKLPKTAGQLPLIGLLGLLSLGLGVGLSALRRS